MDDDWGYPYFRPPYWHHNPGKEKDTSVQIGLMYAAEAPKVAFFNREYDDWQFFFTHKDVAVHVFDPDPEHIPENVSEYRTPMFKSQVENKYVDPM